MVRPASDTCYAIPGTVIIYIGVPSKLKGCVSKVDRYTFIILYQPICTLHAGFHGIPFHADYCGLEGV